MAAMDIRTKIVEFEQQRQTLMNMNMQLQQTQASVAGVEKALEELSHSEEEKVYKAVGNILILRSTKDVKKELEDLKETQSVRVKTLEKQEKSLVEKLNTLRAQIEMEAAKAQGSGTDSKSQEKTTMSPKKKSE